MGLQRKMLVIVPIFMIVIPIMFFAMFSNNNTESNDSPFSNMWPIFLLPMILFMVFAFFMSKGSGSFMTNLMDQNINQAKIAKEKLLSSMDVQVSKQYLSKQLTCFNCGEVIDINSLFCMNCGDSTKEERAEAEL